MEGDKKTQKRRKNRDRKRRPAETIFSESYFFFSFLLPPTASIKAKHLLPPTEEKKLHVHVYRGQPNCIGVADGSSAGHGSLAATHMMESGLAWAASHASAARVASLRVRPTPGLTLCSATGGDAV